MKIPYVLETIFTNPVMEVTRVKVPGGWLVNTIVTASRGSVMLTTVNIVDPEWTWEIANDAAP